MIKHAKENHDKIFLAYESKLLESDMEFIELFNNFVLNEVSNQNDLDDKTRFMAILATLLGCQGIEEFKVILKAAYNFGVTPVEMKEIVYQGAAYLGIGRVLSFLYVANNFCEENGITLPLEKQATTNFKNRLEKGIQAQVDIFGDDMKDFYKSGPEESRHINYWLASNCFGDYYTRGGWIINKEK